MELYIGDEEVAHRAKPVDLESALAAVKALGGTKDLCLQRHENAPQVILTVYPPFDDVPWSYGIEIVEPNGNSEGTFSFDWEEAANAMRRHLAGRPALPPLEPIDDCPLCKMMGH